MRKAKSKKKKKSELDELIDFLPEEFRNTWERMPDDMKEYFVKAAEESKTPEEFISRIMVGCCPQCGSPETISCEEVEEIEDPTVGICKTCGLLWCLECQAPIEDEEECLHWDICRKCEKSKDLKADCGEVASECEKVKKWFEAKSIEVTGSICSWCGKKIPEDEVRFVFGAKIKNMPQELKDKCGRFFIPFGKSQKKIGVIVPLPSWKIKKHNCDIIFVACSRDCVGTIGDYFESEGLSSEFVFDLF